MSFSNYRDIQSHFYITNQPQALAIPVPEKSIDTASLENGYPHHHGCELHGQTFSEHHRGHNIRLRQFLFPAIFSLVTLGGLIAWSFVNWYGWGPWGADLMGRDDKQSTPEKTSVFQFLSHSQLSPTHMNLLIYKFNWIISTISIVWLLGIIVGIPVVIIAGTCITACCCPGQKFSLGKQSLFNPLTLIFKTGYFKKPCCFICYCLDCCCAGKGMAFTFSITYFDVTNYNSPSPPPLPVVHCIQDLCACCVKGGDTLGLSYAQSYIPNEPATARQSYPPPNSRGR